MSKKYTYYIQQENQLTEGHLQLKLLPLSEKINYSAGNYLKILCPNGEWLPFSIANKPNLNNEIELHIRLSNDPVIYNFLEKIKYEKQIIASGPYGDCCYKNNEGPLLLIAAGTGFAAAKAIIEELIASNQKRECHLYWSVKHSNDFYLAELPRQWQKMLIHFSYVPICTQEVNWEGKTNILEAIQEDFVDFSSCQVYVFGPTPLALTTLELFSSQGLKTENFNTDVISHDQIEKLLR